jgi:ferrochelatase
MVDAEPLLQEGGVSRRAFCSGKLQHLMLFSSLVGLGLAVFLSLVPSQEPAIDMAWQHMQVARTPPLVRAPPPFVQHARPQPKGLPVWQSTQPAQARQSVQTAAATQHSGTPQKVAQDAHTPKEKQNGGVGVLLLNLGGPAKLEDVEPFLKNLFADPEIIRLPSAVGWLQEPLATFISRVKAPKSKKGYAEIGGGSPLLNYTEAQAKAIVSAISKRAEQSPEVRDLFGSAPVKTYIGMRYWHPFTEEALEQIQADGVSKLVILPLYPQFSVSTSGSSLGLLQEKFMAEPEKWNSERMQHIVVPNWYQRPGYIETMTRLVKAEVDKYTPEQRKQGVHVLFSAHGVPVSYVEAGDPYQVEIEHCMQMIAKGLPPDVKSHLAYQSKVGPVEWLGPYTDNKLRLLGLQQVKNVVVVPMSFVSEHIETLLELDIEYKEVAEESGISGWRRVPALNLDQAFIDDLANAVIEAVEHLGEGSGSLQIASGSNAVAAATPKMSVPS